jgi:hypothetical protein
MDMEELESALLASDERCRASEERCGALESSRQNLITLLKQVIADPQLTSALEQAVLHVDCGSSAHAVRTERADLDHLVEAMMATRGPSRSSYERQGAAAATQTDSTQLRARQPAANLTEAAQVLESESNHQARSDFRVQPAHLHAQLEACEGMLAPRTLLVTFASNRYRPLPARKLNAGRALATARMRRPRRFV